ncbi:ABC transporter ATP-binding protein [Umezawaea beigongshangensis]|uniref:ABC transporter ATP-binding protein n=1 Tax=Umezawaea beigongshangensis TaxID=2780383 RepID=UPI0018F20430|nr:ABC transporter ATP-binding protein [Umezawaea beigongshangensis]
MAESSALIGVDDLEPPKWAAVDARVAGTGVLRTLGALPAAAAVVVRLSWETSRRLTLLSAVLHLVSGCVTAFGLYATAGVFTSLLEQGPTPQRLVASLPSIALVVGSFALRGLLDAAVGAVQGALGPRVRAHVQDRLNVEIARVELVAFEDPDFRELVRQGGRHGVQSVEMSIRSVSDLASSSISVVAAVVTAGLLDPLLAPVLLLAALANGWAAMRAAKMRYESFLRMVTQNLRLFVVENLLTARDVAVERQALTLQDVLIAEHRRISGVVTAEAVRLERRSSAVRLLGRTLAGIGTGVSYAVLGLLLYLSVMPLALAGAAVVAMRTASTSLSTVMHGVNSLYEHSFYVAFYEQLLHEARARGRAPTGVSAPSDPGVIELDDVSFTYPDSERAALSGITLKIRRGEVVALVGQNGSGKTTLGKLITGLYAPSGGTVRWDGVDLALADPRTVHSRVSVISQEPARWPMTAGHNVRIGRLELDDPDGTAWERAVAHSGADEVIETLPRGEHSVLSKQFRDGQEISGGQWQRIGVARGIYRDAAVLVADEPTAALDAKAEARVFAGLQHASRAGDDERRTTVLVTHRLANVRDADRIVVLEDGRVAQHGTHDELMAGGGPYRELFDIQARAYR